jgi:hypothetical protein
MTVHRLLSSNCATYPALCGATFSTTGASSPSQSECLAVVSKRDDVLNNSYLPSAATPWVLATIAPTSSSVIWMKDSHSRRLPVARKHMDSGHCFHFIQPCVRHLRRTLYTDAVSYSYNQPRDGVDGLPHFRYLLRTKNAKN